MNNRYDSPYSGRFQQSQQQMYGQPYYQHAAWQPVFQPVGSNDIWSSYYPDPDSSKLMVHPQAFAMQQQQPPYAPSPSCPSLYSLQQQQKSAAYSHQKLVPAQIASSRSSPSDYRQHPTLQAPFQQQQQHPSPWYGYDQWQPQQYPSHVPLRQLPPPRSYVDENAPYAQYQHQQPQIYNEPSNEFDYPDPAFDPLKDLKLIPASASKIPPHPTVENSAVPLTEFAVELIWEVCMSAKEQAIAMRENRQHSRYDTAPSTPGQYGSIGGERAARRAKSCNSPSSLEELYFSGSQSYLSSPESPAGPLTPPSSTMSTACPIPVQFQNGKAEFMQGSERAPWIRDALTASPGSPRSDQLPTANFRRFVKDLLTATLVTPQVLLLSMLYVARIPQATEEGGWNKFLMQGMPYKMVLGSLICANKVRLRSFLS